MDTIKFMSYDNLALYDENIKSEIDKRIDENTADKKEKDLIVTYRDGSTFDVTHSSQEVLEAVNNGRTVKFKKDTELLNLLEITADYATFYMVYVNMNGKLQQKIVVVGGSSIMLEQDDTYNYATITQLNNKADSSALNSYYTKIQTDEKIADLVNSAPETLDTLGELAIALNENKEIVDVLNEAVAVKANQEDVLIKAEQTLTEEELDQVRQNLRFIGKNVSGKEFTIDGDTVIASDNAEIFGDYDTNIAVGQWSIAEGSTTIAKGRASHAEGAYSQALADGTHVEGYGTKATGYWSHAEGEYTVVSSYASHAEGSYTRMPDGSTRYGTASGYASHVEGGGSHASGVASHAEGIATDASGRCSHTQGLYTIAAGQNQHAEGCANIEDTNNQYIHIAGNGTSPTDRSNAHTLDWNGNAEFMGDVVAHGCSSTEVPISLVNINNIVQSLDEMIGDGIEDITSEEIQALFA